MKLNFLKKFSIGAALLCTPLFTMAWGQEGHRICGQIAESYLTPKAKAAVHQLLGDESIAIASNWADFIKSDQSYSYLSSWHYIDFDKAYTLAELKNFLEHDNATDAYTKLSFMIGEMKKKETSKENRLLFLRMIIHIVEDLHQPLHTGHTADQGGNKVKVTWNGNPTNLHSLWDSGLIEFQGLSYTEYAAAINHTTAAERAELQKAPISQWLYESSQLAEKIYADNKDGDTIRSFDYNFRYVALLNQQLLKGGVRLAGVLNEIFA